MVMLIVLVPLSSKKRLWLCVWCNLPADDEETFRRGVHQMGESTRRVTREALAVVEALGVGTSGGRVQVRWDHGAATTPFGQLVFFVEFLTLTGVLDRWIASCPLMY